VGEGSAQLETDLRQYARQIGKNLIVPKPQHATAMSFQPGGANRVSGGTIGMLTTVYFNHELVSLAEEIEHITPERMLASELEPLELAAAQRLPQIALGLGQITAQSASRVDSHNFLAPPLTRLAGARHPLPMGEGYGRMLKEI
jgi:hypothetical protein